MPSSSTLTRTIAEHRDEDRVLTWIEVVDNISGYHAGFMLSDGMLLETVDFDTGLPNWDEAGDVDINLASDPGLVRNIYHRFGLPVPPDPQHTLKLALDAFKMATKTLSEVWENFEGDAIANYPECLPSFDEFAPLVQVMEVKRS